MNDSDTRARLAATGKARWRERFTWTAIGSRYEAILADRGSVDSRWPGAEKEDARRNRVAPGA